MTHWYAVGTELFDILNDTLELSPNHDEEYENKKKELQHRFAVLFEKIMKEIE